MTLYKNALIVDGNLFPGKSNIRTQFHETLQKRIQN